MKKFIVIVLGLSTGGTQPLYAAKARKPQPIESKPDYQTFFKEKVVVDDPDVSFVRSKEEPVQGEEGAGERESQQAAARRLIEAARRRSEQKPDEAMSTSAADVPGEKAATSKRIFAYEKQGTLRSLYTKVKHKGQEKLGLVSNQKKLERRIKRQLAREQKATEDLSNEQKKKFLDEVYGRDAFNAELAQAVKKIPSDDTAATQETPVVVSEPLTKKEYKARQLRIKKLQAGRDKIAAMIKEKPQESVSVEERPVQKMVKRPVGQMPLVRQDQLPTRKNIREDSEVERDQPVAGEEQGRAKNIDEIERASQPEQSQQNLSGPENLRLGIPLPVGRNTPPPPVPRETLPPPASRPLPKLPTKSTESSEMPNPEQQNAAPSEGFLDQIKAVRLRRTTPQERPEIKNETVSALEDTSVLERGKSKLEQLDQNGQAEARKNNMDFEQDF